MTAPRAYVLPLPRAGQRPPNSSTQKNLSALGVLNSDSGSVESISTEPGTQSVQGYYRGRYAWKMAAELDELAALSTAVPVYGTRDSDASGYYAINRVSADGVEAQVADWLQQYSLEITREGTRGNRRREVKTNRTQRDHPFGNDTTVEVAVPTTATDVQWYDDETEQTADATPIATRSAELGDVDVLDADAAPYDTPSVVYDLPYADEGPADLRVWDERGVGARTDSDGVLQWQKCFSTAHEYLGETIVSNGLVRLRFDAGTPQLTVERWDDGTSSWTAESLGTSDWTIASIDVRHIGLARVDARCVFEDTTQSPTATYPLDLSVKRGWQDPLWARIPDESDPFPAGLKDLLTPVASTQIYDPNADQTLIAREDL